MAIFLERAILASFLAINQATVKILRMLFFWLIFFNTFLSCVHCHIWREKKIDIRSGSYFFKGMRDYWPALLKAVAIFPFSNPSGELLILSSLFEQGSSNLEWRMLIAKVIKLAWKQILAIKTSVWARDFKLGQMDTSSPLNETPMKKLTN